MYLPFNFSAYVTGSLSGSATLTFTVNDVPALMFAD